MPSCAPSFGPVRRGSFDKLFDTFAYVRRRSRRWTPLYIGSKDPVRRCARRPGARRACGPGARRACISATMRNLQRGDLSSGGGRSTGHATTLLGLARSPGVGRSERQGFSHTEAAVAALFLLREPAIDQVEPNDHRAFESVDSRG